MHKKIYFIHYNLFHKFLWETAYNLQKIAKDQYAESFTHGKLQRSLLLCFKLCHVVIQAALVQYCNTK